MQQYESFAQRSPKTSRSHLCLNPSKLAVIEIGGFHRQFGCLRAYLVAFRLELIAFNDQLIALSHFLDSCIRKYCTISSVIKNEKE